MLWRVSLQETLKGIIKAPFVFIFRIYCYCLIKNNSFWGFYDCDIIEIPVFVCVCCWRYARESVIPITVAITMSFAPALLLDILSEADFNRPHRVAKWIKDFNWVLRDYHHDIGMTQVELCGIVFEWIRLWRSSLYKNLLLISGRIVSFYDKLVCA